MERIECNLIIMFSVAFRIYMGILEIEKKNENFLRGVQKKAKQKKKKK